MKNKQTKYIELFEIYDIIQNKKKIITLSLYIPREILLKHGRISHSFVTEEGYRITKEAE